MASEAAPFPAPCQGWQCGPALSLARRAAPPEGAGWGRLRPLTVHPWLSAPLGAPRRWRHCTRSPPTAPGWCPGFPNIRLHSQSPQLQEKGWGNRKKNNKGTNLANQVWSGCVCRASCLGSVQILRMDSSSPACLPSTSYISSLSSVPQWTRYNVCAPTWTKHRVWRITGPQ